MLTYKPLYVTYCWRPTQLIAKQRRILFNNHTNLVVGSIKCNCLSLRIFIFLLSIQRSMIYLNPHHLTKRGCIFPRPAQSDMEIYDEIRAQDNSITKTDLFQYHLNHCVYRFCTTHLLCCDSCGLKLHSKNGSMCWEKCSYCSLPDHEFSCCPKLLTRLHDPSESSYSAWMHHVADYFISLPPPSAFQNQGLCCYF